MLKGELYNDLHENTSLKNTGFKDENKAINTIKLIKYRSLKYQFDVVNTMYYRAKYHPNKTKNMLKAMKIFKKWLKQYKMKRDKENKDYPWLSIDIINKYKYLIKSYNISKKYTMFYSMYKKTKKHKLQYILYNDKYDFWSYRIKIIKSILKKINKLYYKNGLPTKKHLILILHGYSLDNSLIKN